MESKLVHFDNKCYGCKTCELICSFHRTGEFKPSASSISIIRDHVNGIWEWILNDTCDMCKNEREILCIKFCKYEAIKIVCPSKEVEKSV